MEIGTTMQGLCLVNIFILVPQMLSFSSALFFLCWTTMGWLILGLSSYIVGETWKCNTKKRCVLTSLVLYLFLQVSLTVTHSSLWSTLKQGRIYQVQKFFFFWYSASIGSYCSGEVCTNLYMCSSQEQAMYCFLTWLCFVQVIKAQHSHQGRGGATIQVVYFNSSFICRSNWRLMLHYHNHE